MSIFEVVFIALASIVVGGILLFVFFGAMFREYDHIGAQQRWNLKHGYNRDGTPKENQGETDS